MHFAQAVVLHVIEEMALPILPLSMAECLGLTDFNGTVAIYPVPDTLVRLALNLRLSIVEGVSN